MLYAHLTKVSGGYELTISTSPDLRGHLSTILVTRFAGKREAREYAKRMNAKPWNF
jgi:hypothetical protein